MSQPITIWGASYQSVGYVDLPKTGGGQARFHDVSDTTAAASDVASGKYFYTASGVRTAGTGQGSTVFVVSVSYNQSTYTWELDRTWDEISAAYSAGKEIAAQADPSTEDLNSVSVDGYWSAQYSFYRYLVHATTGTQVFEWQYTLEEIGLSGGSQRTYIMPSGNISITENGAGIDVSQYATASVAVPIVTYYTSSATPTSSQGSDGDIWLVTS